MAISSFNDDENQQSLVKQAEAKQQQSLEEDKVLEKRAKAAEISAKEADALKKKAEADKAVSDSSVNKINAQVNAEKTKSDIKQVANKGSSLLGTAGRKLFGVPGDKPLKKKIGMKSPEDIASADKSGGEALAQQLSQEQQPQPQPQQQQGSQSLSIKTTTPTRIDSGLTPPTFKKPLAPPTLETRDPDTTVFDKFNEKIEIARAETKLLNNLFDDDRKIFEEEKERIRKQKTDLNAKIKEISEKPPTRGEIVAGTDTMLLITQLLAGWGHAVATGSGDAGVFLNDYVDKKYKDALTLHNAKKGSLLQQKDDINDLLEITKDDYMSELAYKDAKYKQVINDLSLAEQSASTLQEKEKIMAAKHAAEQQNALNNYNLEQAQINASNRKAQDEFNNKYKIRNLEWKKQMALIKAALKKGKTGKAPDITKIYHLGDKFRTGNKHDRKTMQKYLSDKGKVGTVQYKTISILEGESSDEEMNKLVARVRKKGSFGLRGEAFADYVKGIFGHAGGLTKIETKFVNYIGMLVMGDKKERVGTGTVSENDYKQLTLQFGLPKLRTRGDWYGSDNQNQINEELSKGIIRSIARGTLDGIIKEKIKDYEDDLERNIKIFAAPDSTKEDIIDAKDNFLDQLKKDSQ